MIRQVPVVLSNSYVDGTRMFPGIWIETWILMAGTGVWMLVDFRPKKDLPS